MTIGMNGKAEIRQYWDLDASTTHESRDESYYVGSYRELLEGAVQSHLMSDVPLGVFLSGGVDSSAVAALMTKLRREPVETFSVGYAEQAQSELPFARTWRITFIPGIMKCWSAKKIFLERCRT